MSRKSKFRQLTRVELEIMKVLWSTGPATVQTVRDGLSAEPRPAYTTVQTMLNILHRKGKVKRVRKGKAYEYSPLMSRQNAVTQVVRDLLNGLFGGSAEELVMALLKDHHLTPERLTKLEAMVEASGGRGAKGQGK